MLISVVDETTRAVREGGPYSAMTSVVLSDRLDAMGLQAGDRIAIVGGSGIYAARLTSVKIVAEIMGEDTPAFWRLTPEKTGIVPEWPSRAPGWSWHPIPVLRYAWIRPG
jgi:hypothetical protein